MPLTEKGAKIKKSMVEQYGEEKGEEVLYASKNKGTITGIDQVMPPTSSTPVSATPAPGIPSATGTEPSGLNTEIAGTTGPIKTLGSDHKVVATARDFARAAGAR